VIDTARNAFGITGGNMDGGPDGDGYVSINFLAAPELSTWAMSSRASLGSAGSLACADASSRRPDARFEAQRV
jgi:hypothetical protein